MLNIERVKTLLKDSEFSALSDPELEVLRNDMRSMAEIIFSKWIKQKEYKDETRKKGVVGTEK